MLSFLPSQKTLPCSVKQTPPSLKNMEGEFIPCIWQEQGLFPPVLRLGLALGTWASHLSGIVTAAVIRIQGSFKSQLFL